MLLVLLLLVLIAVGVLASIYFADERHFRKLAPHVNSYGSHTRLLKTGLAIQDGKSVLDLGCGDGRMLRFFMRHKGCRAGVGYDIRRLSISVGNIIHSLTGLGKVITLYNQDYHNADLASYDIIYLFLWPDVMPGLEQWLQKSIGENTVVITNTFHFPSWQPNEVITNSKGKSIFKIYKKY